MPNAKKAPLCCRAYKTYDRTLGLECIAEDRSIALQKALRSRSVNALPVDLLDAPSLIDFDYWEEVHSKLRKQGMTDTTLSVEF